MSESDLYKPVHDFLELRFRDRLKPLYGELRGISAITATSGGSGTGIWSKPDLCLLALWRHKYGLAWQLDIHGFEVKTESGCSTASVHEALNHTSLVHYAHLVWHAPAWLDEDERCRNILDQCARFGVGLITLTEPANASTYAIRLPARRHEPTPDALDEFIETRLQKEDRAQLVDWLREVR